MRSRSEHDHAVAKVRKMLAGLLGISPVDIKAHAGDLSGPDLVAEAAGKTFVVEFKKSTGAAPIATAIKQLSMFAERFSKKSVPLLAVPFMGEVGRHLCEEAGVGWIDLSGNARIVAPGLRVIVDGRPNLFRSVGRPPSLFAAKSSRVIRWLLIHHAEPLTQRQIARATYMTEGFVSRIVRGLEQEGYLVRDQQGAIRPKDPALLLDAWRDAYRFSRHTIHKGHVAVRSGDALLRFVSNALVELRIDHAATGLAGAWALTQFAAFRITTVYIPTDPSPALLERLSCHEDPRGANLWLVVPNDMGVFQGATEKDGIHCVHPVQVYIDLKGHPERASEAAEHLRTEYLNWGHDG